MRFKIPLVCALISVCLDIFCSAANITLSHDSQVSRRALSRKKRYLAFPSGSVMQLGYCMNVPSLIPGGIWYYGITFGANWEVPANPLGLKLPKRAAVLHRRDRLDFYQKLLPVLNTMGFDGEMCLLRALCESGQRPHGVKGSFLEEIVHALFTVIIGLFNDTSMQFWLPETKMVNEWEVDEDFNKYDNAHRTKEACSVLFPSCFKDLDAS